MRSYPTNSPQAAARIAALTVVADGDIGDAEIEWLDRLAVHEQLGLARHESCMRCWTLSAKTRRGRIDRARRRSRALGLAP